MRVPVEHLPPKLREFFQEKWADLTSRKKTVLVNVRDDGAELVYERSSSSDWGVRTGHPTYVVNLDTGQSWRIRAGGDGMHDRPIVARSGSSSQALHSGEAVAVYHPSDYHSAASLHAVMLKADEKRIIMPPVEVSGMAAQALYVFTRINSRGSYRAEAWESFERRYGVASKRAAIDRLLELSLITRNKADAVTPTPLGQQVASKLQFEHDPSRWFPEWVVDAAGTRVKKPAGEPPSIKLGSLERPSLMQRLTGGR